MIQSACANDRLVVCSMTMTDLPASTSRSSRPSSLLDVGEMQGPLVGSSSTRTSTVAAHMCGQLEPLPLPTGQAW